ncbi:MAG: DUF1967 domain-containing protein, partial [Ruminococcaceae bacterium]|nr:DUF1967 domain-containing protein [Oscillospiraceae bacterium]
RPKIANYHFTTLIPNLGIVTPQSGESFVMADIPGIIEGAHEGVGLGHEFLRHIERTRLLIHVIDVSGCEGRNPLEDFEIINQELQQYSASLSEKEQIIAANKLDLLYEKTAYEEFKATMEEKGFSVFPISAATGQGVQELISYAAERLSKIPVPVLFEEETGEVAEYDKEAPLTFTVTKMDADLYEVSGSLIDKIMASTNFADNESVRFFQRALRSKGIIDALREKGAGEGDTVKMLDFEFDFID